MKLPRFACIALGISFLLGLLGGGVRCQTNVSPASARQPAPRAIQVLKIESTEIKLPPAFQMAIYENALSEIKKTGIFEEIYRDGDRRAAASTDRITLRTDVRGFTKGSAMERQVITVAGKTSIKVHLEVVNQDGKILLEKDLEGKVRFFGENMRATFDLAKAIARTLKDNFQKPPAAVKS